MYNETYLAHHGVKGQKWGVRRQQERIARREKREWRKQVIGQANADYASRKIKYNTTHNRIRDTFKRHRYDAQNIKKRDEYVKSEWIKKYGEKDYNKTVRREVAAYVATVAAFTAGYAYLSYKAMG